jgi:hypothetical protein
MKSWIAGQARNDKQGVVKARDDRQGVVKAAMTGKELSCRT